MLDNDVSKMCCLVKSQLSCIRSSGGAFVNASSMKKILFTIFQNDYGELKMFISEEKTLYIIRNIIYTEMSDSYYFAFDFQFEVIY